MTEVGNRLRVQGHEHQPMRHWDERPAWCDLCGLDARGRAVTTLGRLTLVIRACDTALASPDLNDATRSLIEAIREQARGDRP